ncbi:hypothetical protein AB1A64_20865 [Ruegeria sp. ANG10]
MIIQSVDLEAAIDAEVPVFEEAIHAVLSEELCLSGVGVLRSFCL